MKWNLFWLLPGILLVLQLGDFNCCCRAMAHPDEEKGENIKPIFDFGDNIGSLAAAGFLSDCDTAKYGPMATIMNQMFMYFGMGCTTSSRSLGGGSPEPMATQEIDPRKIQLVRDYLRSNRTNEGNNSTSAS